MKAILLLSMILSFRIIHSQVVNPKIWHIGYQSYYRDTIKPDTGHFIDYGSTILNFKQNPIGIGRYAYTLSFGACNNQIYDKNDSLILYSNGSKIFNGKHRLIEGGDKLSYGTDWNTSPFAGNYFGEYYILIYPNPMLILPSVANSNQYYIISVFINSDNTYFPKLTYSLIDMSLNNGKGKVIEKEVLIKTGDFAPAITACKHGNGRDWWIIAREYGKTNFTLMLLDASGIRIASENQQSGWDLSERGALKGNTTNRFSWDGSKFASFTHLGTELFDFNRCTGEFKNRREFNIPVNDSFPTTGIGIFSPNNRLIYTGNAKYIYQIDATNSKTRLVSTWDGFHDTAKGANFGWGTSFGSYQLASNGKLYIATNFTTRYMHTIENPNDTGILCNFKQRSVKLLTWNNGVPHYPNYELGAVADKCGESGITDNLLERIEVYPNPAKDFIILEGKQILHSNIKLYNLLGQQISPIVELTSRGYRIDIKHLPNGVYFIQITDKRENTIFSKKIVIDHE